MGTPDGFAGIPEGKEDGLWREKGERRFAVARGRRVGKHGFINLWFVCLSCEVDGLDGLIKSQSVKTSLFA